MANTNLFELVKTALPAEFDPQILKQYGKPEWWENRVSTAVAYALRKCGQLDWKAYLAHNDDVKKTGKDPVYHFIKSGVFEGRRLYLARENTDLPHTGRPRVSVVIPNYNNEIFLTHSIKSVLNQTLKSIEIIIVDSGSTDASLEIIKMFAKKDGRIKIIKFDWNKGPHLARKAGVEAASGEYIMFMDSDDYYRSEACRLAYEAIRDKYDIVGFNCRIISPPGGTSGPYEKLRSTINSGPLARYADDNLVEVVFLKNGFSTTIWNKIYRASVCKRAFSLMEDKPLYLAEDIYETLAIFSQAKSAAKVDNHLYHYRVNMGISSADSPYGQVQRATYASNSFAGIKNFLNSHLLGSYADAINTRMTRIVAEEWRLYSTSGNCREFFDAIADNIGIVNLVNYFVGSYFGLWHQVANVFRNYGSKAPDKPVRRVGIVHPRLSEGGSQTVVMQQALGLAARGYQVVLFMGSQGRYDFSLPEEIKIVYYGKDVYEIEAVRERLGNFDNMLKKYPVDILFFHGCWDKSLLWHLMIAKYRAIHTVIVQHATFYIELMVKNSNYYPECQNSVQRCADKLVVLSRYEELYYRTMGIDAQYIPNPVRFRETASNDRNAFKERRNNIIVVGRFNDQVKNMPDSLKILAEIIMVLPSVNIIYVGKFAGNEQRDDFINLAKDLGVEKNISFTGWLDDFTDIMSQAGLLLSTSRSESFPLSILDAQSCGLPVAMYELPIMQAIDNESILGAPMGDYKALSGQIIELLSDENRWRRLSAIAREKASAYSQEAYINRNIELINNINRQSEISNYTEDDYRVVIRTLSHYAGNLQPWQK